MDTLVLGRYGGLRTGPACAGRGHRRLCGRLQHLLGLGPPCGGRGVFRLLCRGVFCRLPARRHSAFMAAGQACPAFAHKPRQRVCALPVGGARHFGRGGAGRPLLPSCRARPCARLCAGCCRRGQPGPFICNRCLEADGHGVPFVSGCLLCRAGKTAPFCRSALLGRSAGPEAAGANSGAGAGRMRAGRCLVQPKAPGRTGPRGGRRGCRPCACACVRSAVFWGFGAFARPV